MADNKLNGRSYRSHVKLVGPTVNDPAITYESIREGQADDSFPTDPESVKLLLAHTEQAAQQVHKDSGAAVANMAPDLARLIVGDTKTGIRTLAKVADSRLQKRAEETIAEEATPARKSAAKGLITAKAVEHEGVEAAPETFSPFRYLLEIKDDSGKPYFTKGMDVADFLLDLARESGGSGSSTNLLDFVMGLKKEELDAAIQAEAALRASRDAKVAQSEKSRVEEVARKNLALAQASRGVAKRSVAKRVIESKSLKEEAVSPEFFQLQFVLDAVDATGTPYFTSEMDAADFLLKLADKTALAKKGESVLDAVKTLSRADITAGLQSYIQEKADQALVGDEPRDVAADRYAMVQQMAGDPDELVAQQERSFTPAPKVVQPAENFAKVEPVFSPTLTAKERHKQFLKDRSWEKAEDMAKLVTARAELAAATEVNPRLDDQVFVVEHEQKVQHAKSVMRQIAAQDPSFAAVATDEVFDDAIELAEQQPTDWLARELERLAGASIRVSDEEVLPQLAGRATLGPVKMPKRLVLMPGALSHADITSDEAKSIAELYLAYDLQARNIIEAPVEKLSWIDRIKKKFQR